VLSDWLVVKVTRRPGETFLDRMIALVEGAKRQKTPNEIALDILLAGLTLIFLIATVTLPVFARIRAAASAGGAGGAVHHADPDDDRRPALGHRHRRHGPAGEANVHRHLGPRRRGGRRRRRAAARQDRHDHLRQPQAVAFMPAPGVTERELAEAAQLASLADETPEGKSIVVLAKERFAMRGDRRRRELRAVHRADPHERRRCRRGRRSARARSTRSLRSSRPQRAAEPARGRKAVTRRSPERRHAAGGGRWPRVLGVVHLKDVVKPGCASASPSCAAWASAP
jgi:K+-transporting ATPase ATPase B chain